MYKTKEEECMKCLSRSVISLFLFFLLHGLFFGEESEIILGSDIIRYKNGDINFMFFGCSGERNLGESEVDLGLENNKKDFFYFGFEIGLKNATIASNSFGGFGIGLRSVYAKTEWEEFVPFIGADVVFTHNLFFIGAQTGVWIRALNSQKQKGKNVSSLDIYLAFTLNYDAQILYNIKSPREIQSGIGISSEVVFRLRDK